MSGDGRTAPRSPAPPCELLAWAASGVMALTGWPDGPPLAPGAPVATRLAQMVDEIALRTATVGTAVDLDLPVVLSARAAALGLGRRGRISANGSCRLLPAGDGWIAANLARPEDIEAVPAILASTGHASVDPWEALARGLASADMDEVDAIVGRARLLGVPVARLASAPPGPPFPSVRDDLQPAGAGRSHRLQVPRADPDAPLAGCTVVDLSSLWAGPMVAHVLVRAGARVVKVESARRPDGARLGPAAWYRWLHAGVEEVSVDLAADSGRRTLRRLLEGADIVIEASRPRALLQLGADPSQLRCRPGVVWLSITAHGREGPPATWTGFGDDAAVAGGLVAWDADGPVFCADALADPATGLAGALAVLRARSSGGGVRIDLALSGVAAELARPGPPDVRPAGHRPGCSGPGARGVADHAVTRTDGRWTVRCGQVQADVRQPVPPPG